MLLVHGAVKARDPVALKTEWLGALTKGLRASGLAMPADLVVDFAFYGDRLDDFVQQFEDLNVATAIGL